MSHQTHLRRSHNTRRLNHNQFYHQRNHRCSIRYQLTPLSTATLTQPPNNPRQTTTQTHQTVPPLSSTQIFPSLTTALMPTQTQISLTPVRPFSIASSSIPFSFPLHQPIYTQPVLHQPTYTQSVMSTSMYPPPPPFPCHHIHPWVQQHF